MLGNLQFLSFILVIQVSILANSTSLIRFALYSEFCWVILYSILANQSSLIGAVPLASTPLIMLMVMSVEVVIIWTLIIILNRKV